MSENRHRRAPTKRGKVLCFFDGFISSTKRIAGPGHRRLQNVLKKFKKAQWAEVIPLPDLRSIQLELMEDAADIAYMDDVNGAEEEERAERCLRSVHNLDASGFRDLERFLYASGHLLDDGGAT